MASLGRKTSDKSSSFGSKREKFAKPVKIGNSGAKKGAIAGFLALSIASSAGMLALKNMQAQELTVVGFKTSVAAGTQLTLDMIEEVPIVQKMYDQYGQETWVGADNKTYTTNRFIKWSDRDCLAGMSTKSAGREGMFVDVTQLSNTKVENNPWYEDIDEDKELYTMDFDGSSAYQSYLIPGCVINLRYVWNVPAEKESEYRNLIANKTEDDINGFMESVIPQGSMKSTDGVTVPISEKIFDNLQVVDFLNSSGESIFNIYYSLNTLGESERSDYISRHASELATSVTPAKIVFVLDSDQADKMAEFESSTNTTQKYTVTKTDSTDSTYNEFLAIAEEISKVRLSEN